jgi:cyclopropane-fatty-acyl-phospholipid synthase
MQQAKQQLAQLIEGSGVVLNGDAPSDPQIHNSRLYKRVMREGSLGVGEAYMDGWWDCDRLDVMMTKLLRHNIHDRIRTDYGFLFHALAARLTNLQSKRKAFEIGEAHYNKGNDLYGAMLDKRMVYTCGYWRDASDLDAAQREKLDLVCRKIGLEKGDKVLDIGCGWGSFAKYAAKEYGARVVGVTVSKEQVDLGRKRCEGLPVEIRLQDYREVDEAFDHIISLGMFEHVGPKNYRTYMEVVSRCLRDDGLFLLHTIGGLEDAQTIDPWINKYIFPNAVLPSMKQIAESVHGLFVVEDWHNFGAHYDKTLLAWYDNFTAGWERLKDRYGKRFYRMWNYYLLTSAATFRARYNQLWQIVLSKDGVEGGYRSIR